MPGKNPNGNVGGPEGNIAIRNAAANIKNDTKVCTSGASTGQNCQLTILATDVRGIPVIDVALPGGGVVPVRGNTINKDMVLAAAPAGAVAVGTGDSGGPVITDSLTPRALGTISAGIVLPVPPGAPPPPPANCGVMGVAKPPFPAPVCFSAALYPDMKALLNGYGAALK